MDKTYLAIAVTPKCNYRCKYCFDFSNPTTGENRHSRATELPAEEIIRIARCAYDEGIRKYRITGGEPLIRPDLTTILQGIAQEDVKINLVTNGLKLHWHLKDLAKINDISVRISVDGFSESLEKRMKPQINSSIEKLKKYGIPTRINAVLTKTSILEIQDLIHYCADKEIDMKILDLYLFPFHPNGKTYWEKNYVSPSPIIQMLEKKADKIEAFTEDTSYGIPMKSYLLGKSRIIVKDSAQGTHFHPLCKDCPIFPCLEGFYAPLLTADGTLYPGGCWNPFMSKNLAYKPEKEARNAIKELLKKFSETHHSKQLNTLLEKKLKK